MLQHRVVQYLHPLLPRVDAVPVQVAEPRQDFGGMPTAVVPVEPDDELGVEPDDVVGVLYQIEAPELLEGVLDPALDWRTGDGYVPVPEAAAEVKRVLVCAHGNPRRKRVQ